MNLRHPVTVNRNRYNFYPNIEGDVDSGCQQLAVFHSMSQVLTRHFNPSAQSLQHCRWMASATSSHRSPSIVMTPLPDPTSQLTALSVLTGNPETLPSSKSVPLLESYGWFVSTCRRHWNELERTVDSLRGNKKNWFPILALPPVNLHRGLMKVHSPLQAQFPYYLV
jgi:hypothetical protein